MSGQVPPPSPSASDEALARAGRQAARTRTTAIVCSFAAIGMVGLSFAAVPLYRLFCQVTGFGGTPQIGTGPSQGSSERSVAVRFDANVAPGVTWQFTPEQSQVSAKLGETQTVFYKITNTGKSPSTGVATFNVQPEQAGAFFVKIQCFCFNEQTLAAGETIHAPVVFYVDPELDKERDLKSLNTITLSYTVFPVKGASSAAVTGEADKSKL